ncbi:MAG TPA: PQQ-binding-like beta-propeller repeat protein, partial [Anaerolineae bacterium]|nr:PQQ-binding-like beta-propeller repeat protein [Anaerolineae bacterium]
YETGGLVFSSPAIGSDGGVYVGSEDCYIYAIGEVWATPTRTAVPTATPSPTTTPTTQPTVWGPHKLYIPVMLKA